LADGHSTWLNDAILTDYILAGTVYISLWETDPLDDGSGTEESGTGYARQPMAPGDWDAIADLNGGRALVSNVVIDFGTVGAGGWGSTIGWVGVHDAVTAGNLLYHYAFTDEPVDLSVVGTPFTIPAGLFVIQEGD
jgi:hypothetical protein